MTTPSDQARQPGWYQDPAGTTGFRWWDGRDWTQHASGTLGSPPARPEIGTDIPTWNSFIGAIAALPVLFIVLVSFWNPVARYIQVPGQSTPTLDPSALFTPALLLLPVLEVLVGGISVLLAYFDWKKLDECGVQRPFHWAWSFFGGPVYVIGRSVIFRKVAPGRGLGPIWVSMGVFIVFIIMYVTKWVEFLT